MEVSSELLRDNMAESRDAKFILKLPHHAFAMYFTERLTVYYKNIL